MPEMKTQHENVKQRKTKFNRDLWKYTVDKDSADATHDSVAFVTPGSGRMFKFEDITAVHAAIIDSGGLMGLVELKTAVFRLYVDLDFSPPAKQDPEVTRFWNECEAKLSANNWEWTRDTVSERSRFHRGGLHAAVWKHISSRRSVQCRPSVPVFEK
jgi:hypothetical protein